MDILEDPVVVEVVDERGPRPGRAAGGGRAAPLGPGRGAKFKLVRSDVPRA
jgi:hypothetical protein